VFPSNNFPEAGCSDVLRSKHILSSSIRNPIWYWTRSVLNNHPHSLVVLLRQDCYLAPLARQIDRREEAATGDEQGETCWSAEEGMCLVAMLLFNSLLLSLITRSLPLCCLGPTTSQHFMEFVPQFLPQEERSNRLDLPMFTSSLGGTDYPYIRIPHAVPRLEVQYFIPRCSPPLICWHATLGFTRFLTDLNHRWSRAYMSTPH